MIPRSPLRRGSPPARKSRPRKQRKTTLAALKRKLWRLFAAYVLERDGRRCFTCGGVGTQAGHFYSTRIASTWIDPKNVHAQCGRCNLFLHSNPGAYSDGIFRKYGPEELMRLTMRAMRVDKQWRAPEVESLIAAIQRSGADFELAYYAENL